MILLNDFAKFASLRAVIELPQLFIIALNYKIGQALIQLQSTLYSKLTFPHLSHLPLLLVKKMRGIRRALNSHALSVRLTQTNPISRSHAKTNISHAFKVSD